MSFSLYPIAGTSFDIEKLCKIVRAHPFSIEHPPTSCCFYVEADEESIEFIRSMLLQEPELHFWAVRISLSSHRINVQNEARQEALDAFRPMLAEILRSSPVGRISRADAYDLKFQSIEEAVDALLS